MSSVSDATKSLAEQPRPQGLQELMKKSLKEIARALPKHLTADRLTRIALTCIRLNPELAKCTPESFMGSLFTSAQLGIEPVGGRAYLLPFRNKRKKPDGTYHTVLECQFVVGYKGLAELFYRHEKAVELWWGIVHQNDKFDYEMGTNSFLKHVPAMSNRGEPIAYYVGASLKGGGKPFFVMSREDCMEHGRKHSKTYDKTTNAFYRSSPWATSPDAMCLKTCLIQLAKLLPLSIELQKAISADETSRDFRAGIDDALDIQDTTDWTPPENPVETTVEDGDAQEPAEKQERQIGEGGRR